MAHIWFMHDAHLGCALFFLDMLAEYTLLSMTVTVTPCLWYVVGMKLVCPMSKFSQAPFARANADSHAIQGKWPFSKEQPSTKAIFPLSRGKNGMSQGVEIRAH